MGILFVKKIRKISKSQSTILQYVTHLLKPEGVHQKLFEGCRTNRAVVPLFVEEVERGKGGQTERVPSLLSSSTSLLSSFSV